MKTTAKKTIVGTVVSDRMEKTIRVLVRGKKQHPKYKKYIPTKNVYFAHDEENGAKEGDVVQISFTRPISKQKCWKLDKIISVAD
ncbi:MAG: 30S ribosomal protein S17 [Planctomycetes bacterium]|nr:30S ribosomal protein S17 [Planctomycetota bacterium]